MTFWDSGGGSDGSRTRTLESFRRSARRSTSSGVSTIKSVDVETRTGPRLGQSAKPPWPARMQKAVEQLKGLAERAKTEVPDLDSGGRRSRSCGSNWRS